ncbi:MAG TPA: hypothetical protein VMS17_22580 [Gemmataceae bacterium]|nr:hypothetical protein [Gemmataceae bacterium]
MLRVCQFCRSSCDGAEAVCPVCGAPLPLEPASAAPPPLRPDGLQPRPPAATESWRQLAAVVGLGLLILVICGGAWGANALLAGKGKTEDSAGRIKVGMHISEVGRILDDGPPRSPSYPRERDWYPADEFGDGTIECEGDGEILKICFVGGYVTSIEESPSSCGPGFHKCTLIVSQR